MCVRATSFGTGSFCAGMPQSASGSARTKQANQEVHAIASTVGGSETQRVCE